MGTVLEFWTHDCTAACHRGVVGFYSVVSSLPAKVKVNNSYLISTIMLTSFLFIDMGVLWYEKVSTYLLQNCVQAEFKIHTADTYWLTGFIHPPPPLHFNIIPPFNEVAMTTVPRHHLSCHLMQPGEPVKWQARRPHKRMEGAEGGKQRGGEQAERREGGEVRWSDEEECEGRDWTDQ